MNSRLLYVFDPLCGWCYAAAPLLRAIAQQFGDSLPIEFHPGLLFFPPRPLAPQYRSHILEADLRIEALSGQPFGEAYQARLRQNNVVILDSSPPAAAVLAVAELVPAQTLAMLEAIQHAHYVAGRNVGDPALLRSEALTLGVSSAPFEAAYQRALAALPGRAAKARAILEASGAQGYPTFLLEVGGRRIRLDHANCYGQPAALAAHVDTLLQTYASA